MIVRSDITLSFDRGLVRAALYLAADAGAAVRDAGAWGDPWGLSHEREAPSWWALSRETSAAASTRHPRPTRAGGPPPYFWRVEVGASSSAPRGARGSSALNRRALRLLSVTRGPRTFLNHERPATPAERKLR